MEMEKNVESIDSISRRLGTVRVYGDIRVSDTVQLRRVNSIGAKLTCCSDVRNVPV